MAFPDEYTRRAFRPRRLSPEVEEIMYEGGRRYEGYQERLSPITDDELNYQTKRFHEKVTDHYQSAYPSRRQAHFAPSASAGQVHRDRELYLSSTERINADVGFGISGRNSAYNQAVQHTGYARHNYDNRCAERGTTGIIQRKYGDGVDMRGDRITRDRGHLSVSIQDAQVDPGSGIAWAARTFWRRTALHIDIHRRRRSSRGIWSNEEMLRFPPFTNVKGVG